MAVVARMETRVGTGTVRAWTLQRGEGVDGLRLQRRALPPLAPGEVRVRMHAVALNHRDLMVANGTSGPAGRSLVPASDGAGEVVAVGADVQGMAVGDRVMSSFFPDWLSGAPDAAATARALGGSMDGVLASEVQLPERAWVPVPAHLSFLEAATLPCAGLTAWHALCGLDPLPPQSTVVVLGTGGVSVFALQLANAAGHRVLLTSSDNDKRTRARALGAFATINYRLTPEWGEAVQALTGGRGADRVLDIGGPETLAQSIAALRPGGTVAVIGRLTGGAPAQFDPAALFAGQKRLAGLMVGSREMALALSQFVQAHALHPVVDRVFPFDQAREALAYLAAGTHFGKVVVELAGSSPVRRCSGSRLLRRPRP